MRYRERRYEIVAERQPPEKAVPASPEKITQGKTSAQHHHAVDTPSFDRLLSATYRFLTIANDMTDENATLRDFVESIKEITDCEAVGIRVRDGKGCIKFGADEGYCEGFMTAENNLSLDRDQCLCTRVFDRQTDTAYPFFSPGGSFFTNDGRKLSVESKFESIGPVRGTCFKMGYRTMGIFPVRSKNIVLGIIHVVDPRPDRLSPQMVQLLEKAALQLGTSIEKTRAVKALEKSHKELEQRVFIRTEELVKANRKLQEEMEQRMVADDRLEEQRSMLQRVFDGISDPLVLLDEKMNVQMLNPAAQQYYGVDQPDKALNLPCYEGLGQFRPICQTCRIPAGVKDGQHMDFEREGFRSIDREENVSVYPLKNREGAAYGAVMQIRDVTESTVIKSQLDKIQQQADLGMLVSSVAHEIKNPNSFIAFNISILKDYLADMLPILDRHAEDRPEIEIGNMPYSEFREDVLKLVDTIEHGAQRIDAFLGNLKEYSKAKTEIRRRKVSLSDVLEKVTALVGTKIKQSVRKFKIDMPDTLPEIYSDPVVLEQVLVNLLVNAAQAADKGDAWIEFRVSPVSPDDDTVAIQVEDNGCGMDEPTQKQIFEPFYSTKVAEGGTGLGLYVCRSLIQQIEGHITVASELGKGTCFTLELPIRKRL